MTDVCQLPALELVRLMTARTVSCREVLDAHLARIDAVNPRLDALVAAADPELLRRAAADVTAAAQAVADAGATVRWDQPACLNRTIELLWESVFLGGDRGAGFEADLAAMGATDPSEELAEFLRQAHGIEFTLTDARRRLADIDTFRLDMLSFMADYDVIIGPAMPGAAKPHHHGLVEISDFSHLMAHNLTGWPAVESGHAIRTLHSPGLAIGSGRHPH